jgi:inorganic triphosphatase YgiF
MSEQELKLHVPMASRAGVERELKQAGAERLSLHAMYFDTPGRELARARVAIRLRREGRNWVQTLKMPGANAITRVEMNHPRPGPILDLSVYAGTEVQDALASIKGQLGLRYETDVVRLLRKTRTRYGTVEIAYDSGVLRAGELELPICEMEFELMSGRPAAIFAATRGWQARYGLVLDPRSKSERGDALAQLAHTLAQPDLDEHARAAAIAQFWGPRYARPVRLASDMTPAQALGVTAGECLDQIARNAAMLAEVDTLNLYSAGQPEHVHQLRVGMRRLRSAWRLFRGWAQLPPQDLQDSLRAHFAHFGANRDQDVLQESIIPALVKAGMPTFPIPSEQAPPETAQVNAASTAFQAWLLDMLEWSLDVRPADSTAQPVSMEAPERTDAASGPLRPARAAPALARGASRQAVASITVRAEGQQDALAGERAGPDMAARDADAASDAAAADGGAKHGDGGTADHATKDSAGLKGGGTGGGGTGGTGGGGTGGTGGGRTAATLQPTIIPLLPPRDPRTLQALLARRLRKWHTQVLGEGEVFADLEIPARHELRKRAKRLRYGLSFAESLLPATKMRDYRRRLAAVQDVLGEMNDLAVAHDLYRQWSSRYPQAWFALGWISARQEKLVVEAQRAFKKLGKAKRFWK